MVFYREIAGKLQPVYDEFRGVKVQTVDAAKRVDGGWVSISADGRTWNCYLGRRAVDQGIIGADLLGSYRRDRNRLEVRVTTRTRPSGSHRGHPRAPVKIRHRAPKRTVVRLL